MKDASAADLIAGLALLLSIMTVGFNAMRRIAKGSFATNADIRALEKTMTTTHILHSDRIARVEHGHDLLEERISHFPDRSQFDGLKDHIAEMREVNATIVTRLEEMPRMREAIENLSKEIRENRK